MNNEGSNKRKSYRGPNLYDREQAPKRIRIPSHSGGRPVPSAEPLSSDSYMDINDDVHMDIPDRSNRSHMQRPSFSRDSPHRRPSEPFVPPAGGQGRPHTSSHYSSSSNHPHASPRFVTNHQDHSSRPNISPFGPPEDFPHRAHPQNRPHRTHPQIPHQQYQPPKMPADNNFVEAPFRAPQNTRRDRGRPG